MSSVHDSQWKTILVSILVIYCKAIQLDVGHFPSSSKKPR